MGGHVSSVLQQNVATQQQQQQQQQQDSQQEHEENGKASYTQLLDLVDKGSVASLDLYDMGRVGIAKVDLNGKSASFKVYLPTVTETFVNKLIAKNVGIEVHSGRADPLLQACFDFTVMTAASVAAVHLSGLGSVLKLDESNSSKEVQILRNSGVKFEDVAGVDEAKAELAEVVEFLKAPARFVKVGAAIPKGLMLSGAPGAGKTLLAKALAGEAGVPFIQVCASEFIEVYAGVGASRVRKLFQQAKEQAPCIVFIDEIDAIGRQRGNGRSGEREQTLNQLLTEMDGFDGPAGILVIAATNRPEVLDSALVRAGRFDRRVVVNLPDVQGRLQILKVHARSKKLAKGFDLWQVAKRTVGFSGADLQNLLNESAILAARRGQLTIGINDIEDATDRVIAGLEGRKMTDTVSKKLIAYHEAGHALVGTLLPHHDLVSKVTLMPRGQAKGLTWFLPGEDQSLISQNMLKARIAGALGGRAAEQIVFGSAQVTTGAHGDLQQVDRIVRSMVTQFGMSDVGSISVDARTGSRGPVYSEDLAEVIDKAMSKISNECYMVALTTLSRNRACLDRIVEELLEFETLTGDRLREIVNQYVQVPERLTAA